MNLVSIFKSLQDRIFNRSKHYEPNMVFRIMFVSPFFELEIDTGDGWSTVHSQTPEHADEDGTQIFPVLRFPSFPAALEYATQTLGITRMKPYVMGVYCKPTASYEKGAEPIVMKPQHIVGDQVVPKERVQAPVKRVLGFTVYPAKQAA